MKVAIIGHGRLGSLLANNLGQDFDIGVYEENPNIQIFKPHRRLKNLQELIDYKIIILAIPINKIESFCQNDFNFLKPGTLFIDTCSVKSIPLEHMKKGLPSNVEILGTHPMFGPDSAKDTLWGNKIVLCPERINDYHLENIKKYLERHGLKVIVTSPEQHDKDIAHSLGLTHLIGRALIEMQAKNLEIDTKGYRRLIKILETVENDTIELFKDMNLYNPYAQKMRTTLISTLLEIDKTITTLESNHKEGSQS